MLVKSKELGENCPMPVQSHSHKAERGCGISIKVGSEIAFQVSLEVADKAYRIF